MKIFLCILSAAVIFSSCVSTREAVTIDSSRHQMESELTELEELIIPLEAAGAGEARRMQSEISSARQMIGQMERDASADRDFSGQLAAWSGRLAIVEGRYREAQALYSRSVELSPGNLPAVILKIRLEGDPSIRLQMVETELSMLGQRGPGIGELNIEKGRALMETERFLEAAGAFDTAFSAGLENVYRESYASSRSRAWELRNVTGAAAGTMSLLGRETISWNDSIAMAKNETQLFRFITGGRNISDSELFSRLVERAFIPYTQDVNAADWPSSRPRADEPVTRAGAAWFIWHLFAETRADRGLLTRFSARYAAGANPRSPIADIPALSPFFDSILGCVENGFMSLPDARNFRPALPVRGAELLAILQRIDD